MLQRPSRYFRFRLVRCIAVLTCLSVATSALVTTRPRAVNAGNEVQQEKQKENGKERKVKPLPPEKGKPSLDLPNLDEMRKHRDNYPEIKPPVASSVRSKRKPLNKPDGKRVGDPGTGGQRSELTGQRSANELRGFHHARKSTRGNRGAATAPPPFPDDTYLQSFVTNALGRAVNGPESVYWQDILRSAYYRDPQSMLAAVREMGRTLFESAEYHNRGRSNHDYVRDLYMSYLMRDPNPNDIDGWNFWTTQCDQNGPEAVRDAFDKSTEFNNLIATLAPNGGISSGLTSAVSARMDPFNQSGDQIEARDCEWSLPLISLPGRAGLDLGMGLSYSSLVWTRSGPYLYFDEDVSQISPGFHLGFAAVQGPHYDGLTGRKVYLLITSAGRRIELRQVAFSNVFESADSSYLQLIDNTASTPSSLTLRTTDGTQITYSPYAHDWQATQIKDRNGNCLTMQNDWRGDIQNVTDTLGRMLYFNSDSNGNLLSIIQWRDGGWQPWATFGWDTPLTMNVSNMTGVVGTFQGDTIPVLLRVGLPDGSYYTFDYNGVGQVTAIGNYTSDTTQQSYISYDYDGATGDCPRVTQTHVSAHNWTGVDGLPASVTTVFSLQGDGSHQMTTADGTSYREYYGSGWKNGLVVESDVYAPGLQKWTTTTYDQDDTTVNYQMNPRVTATTINDSGHHRSTTIDYDGYVNWGLPHIIHEFDGAGTEMRTTKTEYELSQPYINSRIIGLVSERDLSDPVRGLQLKTTFYYDSTSIDSQATYAPQHDSGYSSTGVTIRGNLTHVNRWDALAPSNPYNILTTVMTYDADGSLLSTTDPVGHATRLAYSDSFSDSSKNSLGTYAYPTTVTDADNNLSYVQYDYALGAKSRSQSPAPQGQSAGAIFFYYYDAAARLYEIHDAGNAAIAHTYYGAGYTQTWTSVNSLQDNYSVQTFDGLGRVIAAGGYHPGSAGGYQNRRMRYDQMGRLIQQTNPTETNAALTPYGPDDSAWQFNYPTEYDWKGRPLHVYNMDGSFKTYEYTGCGCAGGEIVTITDEMSRTQKVYSDALGRQVKTEVLNGANVYSTTEALLNARDQAYAIRQFQGLDTSGVYTEATTVYDGYGRVATHKLPQQMEVTTYEYNGDDTVHKVTDPRGVAATNSYDGRHLLTGVSYNTGSSGVPALTEISFQYDAAGNKTLITDGTGYTAFGYDQLSRITSESHYLADVGTPYNLTYGYNLGGELTSVSEASGLQVSYNYDSTGRLMSMPATGYSGVTNFLSNTQYRAFGALKHATYGSSVQLNLTYNTRMQIGQYQVGSGYFTAGATMDYYADGRTNTAFDLSDSRFDRKYDFDFAARLKEAYSGAEAHGASPPPLNQANSPYRQSYTYDPWNNATLRQGRIWSTQAEYDPASYGSDNKRGGFGYDVAGNITSDSSGTRAYDAAGRPATFGSLQNWQIYPNWSSTYPNGPALETTDTFDGSGQVVKHVERSRQDLSNEAGDGYIAYYMTDTPTTAYYVHSTVLGGKTIAEFNQTGAKTKGYVYSEAGRIATQFISGGTNSVELQSTNPVTGAVTTTDANGTYAGRQEPDPLSRDLTAPPDPQLVINPLSVTAPGGDRVMPIEASWGPSQEFLNNNQAWANQMDKMQLRDALNPKNGFKRTAELIIEHNPNIGIQTRGPGGVSLYGQDALNYLLKMNGEGSGTIIASDPAEIGPQSPRRPGVGGEFTEDQKKQLSSVKEAAGKLLEIGACADVLGGRVKAQALLKAAQIFSANTVNPAYKGPGYTVAQEARQLALGSNTNVAWSEVGGSRMYLNDRFFKIDTSPFPDPMPVGVNVTRSHYTQETIFIHELHRNAGYGGDWKADEDRIEAACGTTPSYRKTP